MIPAHYTESKMLPATQGRIAFWQAWIRANCRNATKLQIEQAMRNHVLANAELIGTYQKGDR